MSTRERSERSPEEVTDLFNAAVEAFMDELIETTEHTPEVHAAVIAAALQFAASATTDTDVTEADFVERARRAFQFKQAVVGMQVFDRSDRKPS